MFRFWFSKFPFYRNIFINVSFNEASIERRGYNRKKYYKNVLFLAVKTIQVQLLELIFKINQRNRTRGQFISIDKD